MIDGDIRVLKGERRLKKFKKWVCQKENLRAIITFPEDDIDEQVGISGSMAIAGVEMLDSGLNLERRNHHLL